MSCVLTAVSTDARQSMAVCIGDGHGADRRANAGSAFPLVKADRTFRNGSRDDQPEPLQYNE